MSFIQGFWIYTIIAISIGLTSYLVIFRPTLDCLEEILGERSIYRGVFGFILWLSLSTLAAPGTAILLLANDNKEIIQSMAIGMAEHKLGGDE